MLLLLLSLIQADRSTPEKAFEAYAAFRSEWDPKRVEAEAALAADVAALGDGLRSEAWKARLRARPAPRKPEVQFRVKDRKTQADGTVMLTVERLKYVGDLRFTLARHGEHWLFQSATLSCGECEGKPGDDDCEDCRGSGWEPIPLTSVDVPFALAAESPPRSEDVSTPEAAAKALADLSLHESLLIGRRRMATIDSLRDTWRLLYAPDALAEWEKALQKQADEARRAAAKERPSVESVEVAGDQAKVVLHHSRTGRRMIELKKVGERWLAEVERLACAECDGSGKCRFCGDSGKTKGGRACVVCLTSKGCKACKGKKWREP
jgi:hypothetical protein